jgi:competence protein ComEC
MKHTHLQEGENVRRILITALLAVLVLSFCFGAAGQDFQVHFIDVGQADSTLVIDHGQVMLIDAGENPDGRLVVHYLKALGIEHIDILVGTHPHHDHIGGLDDVLQAFSIGKILMPAQTHTTRSFEDVIDTIARLDKKITVPKVGDTFTLGSSSITVLAPVRTDYININDHSIVLKLVRDGKRFLFEGDAETTSEWHMIANKADLATDVLKVAHHASDTSTNSTFIKAVSPSISVVHVGKGNPYGHPTFSVLKRIPGTIYRTDLDGSVIIDFATDGSLRVRTAQKHGNPAWREVRFIGDRATKQYHTKTCPLLPTDASQVGIFDEADAAALGYGACMVCLPAAGGTP